jgi:hypothetical protein
VRKNETKRSGRQTDRPSPDHVPYFALLAHVTDHFRTGK